MRQRADYAVYCLCLPGHYQGVQNGMSVRVLRSATGGQRGIGRVRRERGIGSQSQVRATRSGICESHLRFGKLAKVRALRRLHGEVVCHVVA